jgi:c-di-GMP-binding flagellar brake protein YcgR
MPNRRPRATTKVVGAVLKLSRRTGTGRVGRRDDRRAEVRQPLGWQSRYAVRDQSRVFYTDSDQVPCVIQDLSLGGAGLELSKPDVGVGDCVVLDLHLNDNQRGASIKLTGVVRHTSTEDGAPARAGVEFVGVGNLERVLLSRLLENNRTRERQAG